MTGRAPCTLTTRFGTEIAAPDEADRHKALWELFSEKIPGLAEEDYAEHPSAWLTYRFDSGSTYSLEVFRKGRVVFASYANEGDVEPAEEYAIARLPPEEIEQAWAWLCDGDVERVRSLSWRAT